MTRHRFIHLVLADDRMTMKPAERVSLGLLAWPAGPGVRSNMVAAQRPTRQTRAHGESVMGIRSWFRSFKSPDIQDEGHSLIKLRYEDPDFEPTEDAAAADVAAVEEDAKYFGPDSPASQDGL